MSELGLGHSGTLDAVLPTVGILGSIVDYDNLGLGLLGYWELNLTVVGHLLHLLLGIVGHGIAWNTLLHGLRV